MNNQTSQQTVASIIEKEFTSGQMVRRVCDAIDIIKTIAAQQYPGEALIISERMSHEPRSIRPTHCGVVWASDPRAIHCDCGWEADHH